MGTRFAEAWVPRLGRCAALALASAVPEPALAEEKASAPPVKFGIGYVGDAFANIRGGIDEGARLMGKLDLTADIDGGALGAPGAQGFINLQLLHGESLSEELVGDAQVIS